MSPESSHSQASIILNSLYGVFLRDSLVFPFFAQLNVQGVKKRDVFSVEKTPPWLWDSTVEAGNTPFKRRPRALRHYSVSVLYRLWVDAIIDVLNWQSSRASGGLFS